MAGAGASARAAAGPLAPIGPHAYRAVMSDEDPARGDEVRGRQRGGRLTVEEDPWNAGVPLASLAEPGAGGAPFFVRSHFPRPELDPDGFALRVAGCVRRPLTLSLNDLQERPARTVPVTLECAGNGRRLMDPTPGGTPWTLGAVSTASFTGTPLGPVLKEAGLDGGAIEVVATGADEGELPGGDRGAFARSLPVEAARDPGVLLAWAMDGEPLPPEHGAPLRLVVPGWYAVASVKWLVRIEAVTEPFLGPYQALRYVYVGEEGTPHRSPVARMRVRAVIARPAHGATVTAGSEAEVAGSAWSGGRRVARVEVSTDGGSRWRDAELGEAVGPHAAVPWRLAWRPERVGTHEIVARATDDAGDVQPLDARWNRYGYGNNVVHRVAVSVDR